MQKKQITTLNVTCEKRMRQTELSGHSSFGEIAQATGAHQFIWNANQPTQNHFENEYSIYFLSH